MSFSKTKIFNIALQNLGISSIIENNNEQDPKALLLSNYYEIARNTVLEAHEWSFATAYVKLSVNLYEPINPNFLFAYSMPSDCIAPRAVINVADKQEKIFETAVSQGSERIILTNHNPCILRYTKRADKEAMYSAAFVNALGFYLAYMAAQTIVGSANKKNTNLQDYQIAIRQAIAFDARKNATSDEDDKDYTEYR